MKLLVFDRRFNTWKILQFNICLDAWALVFSLPFRCEAADEMKKEIFMFEMKEEKKIIYSCHELLNHVGNFVVLRRLGTRYELIFNCRLCTSSISKNSFFLLILWRMFLNARLFFLCGARSLNRSIRVYNLLACNGVRARAVPTVAVKHIVILKSRSSADCDMPSTSTSNNVIPSISISIDLEIKLLWNTLAGHGSFRWTELNETGRSFQLERYTMGICPQPIAIQKRPSDILLTMHIAVVANTHTMRRVKLHW